MNYELFKIVKVNDVYVVLVLTYSAQQWQPWQYRYVGATYSVDQFKYAKKFGSEEAATAWINENAPQTSR